MAKPSWISVSPASGTNNGSFDVVAAKNTGPARNGIITVAGEKISKTVNIDQKIGIFKVKSIILTDSAKPTTVTIGSKKFYLGGHQYPSSMLVPDDAWGWEIHTVVTYKPETIGSGGINVIFEFTEELSDLKIENQNLTSYIYPHISGSRFIINCGNGFPMIPISDKIIATFKNSAGTRSIYFDFYTV